MLKYLQRLWRSAFPIRYIVVKQFEPSDLPAAHGVNGEPLDWDELLPEISKAHTTCKPMFALLLREHAKLEKEYHTPAPTDTEANAWSWAERQKVLNGNLRLLNRLIRSPYSALLRMEIMAKEKEGKGKLDEIEKFFSE